MFIWAICVLFGYQAEALAEVAHPAEEMDWAMGIVKAALAVCSALLAWRFRWFSEKDACRCRFWQSEQKKTGKTTREKGSRHGGRHRQRPLMTAGRATRP